MSRVRGEERVTRLRTSAWEATGYLAWFRRLLWLRIASNEANGMKHFTTKHDLGLHRPTVIYKIQKENGWFPSNSKTVAMSSLALMYNLAIWLFPLRVLSKFSRSKEANNYITGLEIATRWSPMQPKIECWPPTACQWATHVFFCRPLNLKGQLPCL